MVISLLNSIKDSMHWPRDPGKVLVNDDQWTAIAAMVGFSNRELDVSRKAFEGKTREQIAEDLQISTRTVRYYLENVHEKLQVTNRVGLVLRLIQVRDHLTRN